MNGFSIGKKIISVFVVFIMLFTATVITAENGNILKNIDELKDSSNSNKKSETVYDLIFNILSEIEGINHKEIKNLISRCNDNKDDGKNSKINTVSSDFEEYWQGYQKLKKRLNFFGVDNYQEFLNTADNLNQRILPMINILFFLIDIPIIFISSAEIGYIIALGILAIDAVAFGSVGLTTMAYHMCQFRDVDIILHVTNESGVGIKDLNGKITAYNTDALAKGASEYSFTYTPCEITENFDDTEWNPGDGWYALSLWPNINEFLTYQSKAPCPPGNWEIKLSNIDGYEDKIISDIVVAENQMGIIEITLDEK